MTKQELTQLGISYITKFCEINGIKLPKIKVYENHRFNCCGWYRNKTITIVEKKCAREATNPGFSWSHRHYFVDREPCGVVCHEFGHYLHEVLTNNECILPYERQITSYEPDYCERFAETIKLFITNPDLLKQYAPKRYEVLTKKLNLKPIFTETWEELMLKTNMHSKYITATKNKLAADI